MIYHVEAGRKEQVVYRYCSILNLVRSRLNKNLSKQSF